MGGAHRHPGAEHGQDGEFPWSALERAGQREHLQTERRPCDTLHAIEGLAEPALMEQAPGQPASATAGNQQADQQCDRHVGQPRGASITSSAGGSQHPANQADAERRLAHAWSGGGRASWNGCVGSGNSGGRQASEAAQGLQHDPEMRHGRKSSSHRFNGHKAQVAVDTDSQLITAVDVLAGNAADADHALEVVEASEAATGCEVVEVIGDCAYGAGSTRAEFAETGRTVVARVPEIHDQEFFPKTEFQIDLEAGTCTCPNQQTTRDLRAAKDGGGMFVFTTETCAACPLRAQCTRSQGGRTVQLHPQEALLQQARELQASPAFNEARRRRQVVEHRIARLVQLGVRQARYVGRTKTLFQLCLAAAVANLTLLAATSNASTTNGSEALGWSLVIVAALVSLSSLLLGVGLAALLIWNCAHLDQLIHTSLTIVRSLTPPSRPGF